MTATAGATATSPVGTTSTTGGAPGTPTHSWAMTTNPGGRGSLVNPANASSQRIQVVPPHGTIGTQTDFIATDTVTDPLGNTDTSTLEALVERI